MLKLGGKPEEPAITVDDSFELETGGMTVQVESGSGVIVEAAHAPLVKCPQCGKGTYKIENGCSTCIDADCGYGKCDV